MKMKLMALLLATCMVFTACSSAPSKPQDQTASRQKDLDTFVTTLETKHKNLYAKITKEEFHAAKQDMEAQLATMTDSEFFYSLKHLLSLVGDAHTSMGYNDSQYKHLNALGFAVMKFSDGWHLMMLEEQNQQYLGYQLVAINDVPVEEVYDKAKTIISYENEAWAEQQFSNTINFREPLEYLGVVEKDGPVVLSIRKDDNSETEKLEIKSMNEQEIMSAKILRFQPNAVVPTAPTDIYSAYDINDQVYMIQYNSCQENPNLPMKEFVKNVQEAVVGKPYSKIVIDMRYNTGGNSAIFEPMISALEKLQKEQNFSVYTLIGGNTFSSAIINSVQTKDQLNSTLVGTQTGGNVNGYGELKSFDLPNSPVTVYYSTKYFQLIDGYEKDSLYPDVEVEQSFDNYINGIDAELNMVLGL